MRRETKHPEPLKFSGALQMPPSTLGLATMEWNETGTWRYMRPRYVECIPACQYACPTSNDIEAWIRLFEKGMLEEAWEAATLENPFPLVTGRVCFHPCMEDGGCNRRDLGGAVNIQMLERCLGDAMGKELPAAKPLFSRTGKKVAVIGSGPAGLACAYHLSRLGHGVEIFERQPQTGGMLRYGIPSYRLPRHVPDREISMLEKMGILFHLGKGVRDAGEMQELRQHFDAVFIAIGAGHSRAMGIPDEKAPGVMPGLEFLRQVAGGKPPAIGRTVLVVGGGNTALDAARTARRLGAEATIIYRRSRAEMPAFGKEVREAEAEGVKIIFLTSPKRVLVKGGRVTGLECLQIKLGEPDESGRMRPQPIEGSEFVIEGDTIIPAIGEIIENTIIPSILPIDNGAIRTRAGGQTEWSNVFAGGDAAGIPRTVVDALASGKMSAIAIDCFIRKEDAGDVFKKICLGGRALMSLYIRHRTGAPPHTITTTEIEPLTRIIRFADLNPIYFQHSEPGVGPALPVKARLSNEAFTEVHGAPPREVTSRELARCFHCGRCTECDNCYIYCPDVAIEKKEGGFEVDYYYCKGCGVCMKECPRAAIEMTEEPTE